MPDSPPRGFLHGWLRNRQCTNSTTLLTYDIRKWRPLPLAYPPPAALCRHQNAFSAFLLPILFLPWENARGSSSLPFFFRRFPQSPLQSVCFSFSLSGTRSQRHISLIFSARRTVLDRTTRIRGHLRILPCPIPPCLRQNTGLLNPSPDEG